MLQRLRYTRFLPFLLAVPVVLVLLAIAAGRFLESRYLQDRLTDAGSAHLGREIVIDGPLEIAWGWRETRLRAEDVRLANAPGLAEPDMLHIGVLDATFRPLPLLLGRLEIPEVTLVRPTLVLEKTDEDTRNWDLPALSTGGLAAQTVLPNERDDMPIIGRIDINEGTLIYRDRTKDLDVDLRIENASGSGSGDDAPFRFAGKGTISGKPFTLDAAGGALTTLRDTNSDYPLRANIAMGSTKVRLEGIFEDPLTFSGVDAALDVAGGNLANLFYLTSVPFPPTPAYSLSGRVTENDSIWRFDLNKGRVGNSDLKGSGTYDGGRDRPFFYADLSSSSMNIDDLGGFIGLRPRGTETVAPGNRFFPDVPIKLERLRKSDLDVRLKAARLHAPGWPFQSMDVRFLLDDGVLRVDPLIAGVASGTMMGHLVLDGRKDMPQVETDVKFRRLSLREFFGETRFESLSGGRFGGRVMVEGQGRSLAEVMGNSDGRISMLMAGGNISLTIIEAAGIDIAELTPLLFGSDKTTRIRCAIGDFAVRDGLLRSDVFLFDTSDTNLEGRATIDLKAERIDAQVEAHPKDVSLLAARTPITIRGPLKDPDIGINPTGLAARGAGAAALALLNPVAAILPFIDTGGGEDANCRGLIREVRGRYGGDIPGPAAAEAPPAPAE